MAKQFNNPAESAFQFTAQREGGDKPAGTLGDPNHAFQGVNQSTYDAYRQQRGAHVQDVTAMTPPERDYIYQSYWSRGLCDHIALKSGALAICHFDACFNGGGVIIAERTLGEIGPDNILTSEEADAVGALVDGPGGEDAACSAYLQNRLDRFRSLGNAAAEPGWEIRLNLLALFLGLSWRVS